jgi:hypothetical protein
MILDHRKIWLIRYTDNLPKRFRKKFDDYYYGTDREVQKYCFDLHHLGYLKISYKNLVKS